jgi:hypothetical protein
MARSRISIPKKSTSNLTWSAAPTLNRKDSPGRILHWPCCYGRSGVEQFPDRAAKAVELGHRHNAAGLEPDRTIPAIRIESHFRSRRGDPSPFRPGASPPVFEKMCSRWVFAVGLVMLSVAAVSASVRPANRLASRSNGISFCW